MGTGCGELTNVVMSSAGRTKQYGMPDVSAVLEVVYLISSLFFISTAEAFTPLISLAALGVAFTPFMSFTFPSIAILGEGIVEVTEDTGEHRESEFPSSIRDAYRQTHRLSGIHKNILFSKTSTNQTSTNHTCHSQFNSRQRYNYI